MTTVGAKYAATFTGLSLFCLTGCCLWVEALQVLGTYSTVCQPAYSPLPFPSLLQYSCCSQMVAPYKLKMPKCLQSHSWDILCCFLAWWSLQVQPPKQILLQHIHRGWILVLSITQDVCGLKKCRQARAFCLRSRMVMVAARPVWRWEWVVCTWFVRVFFPKKDCSLLLETRLLRAVRLNRHNKVLKPEK